MLILKNIGTATISLRSIPFLFGWLTFNLLFTGCDLELSKWEFSAKPHVIEQGIFDKSDLTIQKTISKSEILGKLDLPERAELQSVKINIAAVYLTFDESIQPDSIRFDLYCSAFPQGSSYSRTIKVAGTQSFLGNEKLILGSSGLSALEAINNGLIQMIKNGQNINFRLTGRAMPSGKTANGRVDLFLDFNVVYWECVEVPEFSFLNDANKGPCY